MRNRYGDPAGSADEQQLGLDLGAAGFKVLHCKHMPVDRNMTLLLLSAEACVATGLLPPGSRFE